MSINRQELLEKMNSSTDWANRLLVEPFFPAAIKANSLSASLDFHLGNRFTMLRGRRGIQHDPLSEEPKRDVVGREVFIPMGEDFILRPGQIVLGTTLEWFRFPFNLMAYVHGRSIWGRRGLLIVTAQAVHPGSSGTITLEMSNLGEVGLSLKPGAAIGQLFFHDITPVSDPQPRKSTFSGAHRPILGKYVKNSTEEFLLDLS